MAIATAVLVGGGSLGGWWLGRRAIHCLGKEEQLRVEKHTEKVVLNGPGVKLLNPLGYRSAQKARAEGLDGLSYLIIKDTVTGEERVERGPALLHLGPYEIVAHRGRGVTLSSTEYLIVEHRLLGSKSLAKGPMVWFPAEPYEQPTSSCGQAAISLQEDEYVRIVDDATGERQVRRGKDLVFLQPTWRLEAAVQKAWTLKAYEYLRLHDIVTGKTTVHHGEQMIFPGPNESPLDRSGKLSALDLMVDEYVKVEDQTTGLVQVFSGVDRVFLGPTEKVLDGGKKKAVQVDEEHAVLVRNMKTGQLCLVTEKQLFVPGPHESVEKVQELIRLADHEAVLVKDKDGQIHVHYGNPDRQSSGPRAFFLPPHSEIVQLWWSSGLRRLKRDLCIERFDTRPQYMWFELDCRTCDNVELLLECTLFWEVVDLAKLVRSTGNLPGDMFNQARAQFIKHVAQVTLKKFMEELHTISKQVYQEEQPFYDARGVRVHSLEVTRYKCSEKRTEEVLQQIIEETTNRLNRISQAESENEVNLFRIQGQIEHERLNGSLLEIQQQHAEAEARAAGIAEAERAAAFVKGLETEVPKLEDRTNMWQTLRKQDALSAVAAGGANLYYTPSDVNLSIKT